MWVIYYGLDGKYKYVDYSQDLFSSYDVIYDHTNYPLKLLNSVRRIVIIESIINE